MLTIPQELQTFRDTISGGIDGMNSTVSDLSGKLSDLSSTCTSAQSGFSNYYSSQNKEKILNKFSKLGEIISKISTSVTSDLGSMLSKAQEIVTKVDRMIELKEEVEEQESIISRENAKSTDNDENTNPDYALLSSARSVKYNDEQEFNRLSNEATTSLNELKGMDASLQFVADFTSNDYLAYIDALQYGTFEPAEFTASNGLTVKYWLYVPDYGQEVENLPVMLYMHGGSTHQNVSPQDAIRYGLSSKIANKELTPSGIVIIPAVTDFTERGQIALKELTDHVVETNPIDPNKISVSGHSYGGITAYNLINRYPDYFSCCVAISGGANVTDAFKGMKDWSFNGTYENGTSWTSYQHGQNAVKAINEIGGEAYLTPLKTGHAGTNKDTYGHKYMSPDGIEENPLDWAFRQEKA